MEKGLKVSPRVKTSLAPGSKVVTDYLRDAGLLPYLEKLGFGVVAYGCTTCMGAAGPLDAKIEEAVVSKDLVTCAVLSGNRNFEARVHANLRANYLASPALVVAYAHRRHRAHRSDQGSAGHRQRRQAGLPEGPVADRRRSRLAAEIRRQRGPLPPRVRRPVGQQANCGKPSPPSKARSTSGMPKSTFIKEPPFFEGVTRTPGKVTDIKGARALAILGDSITTDHISPSTKIKPGTPAGKWLEPYGSPPVGVGPLRHAPLQP